jgi:hypothetical protein
MTNNRIEYILKKLSSTDASKLEEKAFKMFDMQLLTLLKYPSDNWSYEQASEVANEVIELIVDSYVKSTKPFKTSNEQMLLADDYYIVNPDIFPTAVKNYKEIKEFFENNL